MLVASPSRQGLRSTTTSQKSNMMWTQADAQGAPVDPVPLSQSARATRGEEDHSIIFASPEVLTTPVRSMATPTEQDSANIVAPRGVPAKSVRSTTMSVEQDLGIVHESQAVTGKSLLAVSTHVEQDSMGAAAVVTQATKQVPLHRSASDEICHAAKVATAQTTNCDLPAPAATTSAVSVSRIQQSGHRRCSSHGESQTESLINKMEGKSKHGLPPESKAWTQFEINLFLQSSGQYHPGVMASKRRVPSCGDGTVTCGTEVSGRVSVVTPSMSSRQHYHQQLWACFEAQTWKDKELIVLETYESSPSEFLQQKAKEDSRLVHVCLRRPRGCDFSVGLKRNMTLHLASGQYVANFDDDDIYAADYVSEMVTKMQADGLFALTLSSWYNYIVPKRVCAYSDPARVIVDLDSPEDREELDEILYGYGFSYVHHRRVALLFPYPDVVFAEDAPFFLKLKEILGNDRVVLMRDEVGLCMHIVHAANSTGTSGESISHEIEQQELDSLAVAKLPVFQEFLNMHATSWWQLLPFSTWSLGGFLDSQMVQALVPAQSRTQAVRARKRICM